MLLLALYIIPVQLLLLTVEGTILWPTGVPPPVAKCEICSTEQCKIEANYYQTRMDTTVDPCDDFYQFACGNFVKKNANLPSSVPGINSLSIIQDAVNKEISALVKEDMKSSDVTAFKKIKIHYRNCMNETRIEEDGTRPIFELLQSLGGWPILLGNKWNEKEFDLMSSLEKLSQKNFPIKFPFGLVVTPNVEDSTKPILNVEIHPMTYNPAFLANGSKLPKEFLKFINNAAVELGASGSNSHKEAAEIQMFEENFFKATQILFDPTPRHISVKELSRNITRISWLKLFNTILNPSGIRIDENEIIAIPNLKFLAKVDELINQTPKRIVANYLGWSVVQSSLPNLTKNLRQLQTNFMNSQFGTNQGPDRDLFCIENIKRRFDKGVDAMYVRKYFDKQIKNNVEDLFSAIKDQMRINLEKVDWMDHNTKKEALEKLEAMRSNIAYPDELFNDEKINDYYKDLDIKSGSYINDALKISVFRQNKIYRKLRSKPDKYSWTEMQTSSTVNAFYLPQLNLVDVSAAFLRGSMYQYKRPQYLNFGAMGTIIGHEITHGFDNMGRGFDKDANLKNWWDPTTEKRFLEKAQCMIEQYSRFVVKEVGLNVNGALTQGENIADNGGIKLAYHAFNEWAKNNETTWSCLPEFDNYTPRQMFWISAASNSCSKQRPEVLMHQMAVDPHSPDSARVMVTFSNTPEFARDFNCKSGSRMNPKDRCAVW